MPEVVAVVHTEQGNMIRIISIRMATKREEKSYFSTISEFAAVVGRGR